MLGGGSDAVTLSLRATSFAQENFVASHDAAWTRTAGE